MPKTSIAVLIHQPLQQELISSSDRKRLEDLGQVSWWDQDRPATVEEAASFIEGARAVIGSWGSVNPGQEDVLAHCPDLRLWVHAAGSVKKFFTPVLKAYPDLMISSCKDAIAAGVAEQAQACAIFGLRQYMANTVANRQGKASKPNPCRLVGESTVGIVGASIVGRMLIDLLRPTGASILLYDPFVSESEARKMGVLLEPDLVELCRRSHAVSLHTPMTEATRHLLNAEHFQAMAAETVLINTSRGECLDQEALQEELTQGRLTAFLDVTTPENLPEDHPLRRLPNCHLSSHIAGPPSTLIGRQAVDDVAAVLAGGQPKSRITQEMLPNIA